jgi:DNA-binding NarL/FixJ family response regulator
MIRLLLIDDHPLVRAGLTQIVGAQEDFVVVGEAGDGVTGATMARDLKPDIALVDLAMPGMDGIETTRRVLVASPATKVIALTAFSDRQQVLGALDAGAIGYLLKDAEPGELLGGIRAAARGESPLDPRAAHAVLTRGSPEAGSTLTLREREVLQLVAEGLPNKQIARTLGITEKTVKAHMTKVFAAIGVTDRTAAALWAHRNGVGSIR